MDDRTLAALKGSIEKWEKIVAGTDMDRRSDNCPLCAEFINGDEERGIDGCSECPVMKASTFSGCRETPYDEWATHQKKDHLSPDWRLPPWQIEPGCAECSRLARAELDFLRSLLPDAPAVAAEPNEGRG